MAGVAGLAIRTTIVWDQLPAVVASHFGANGVANGWMPRSEFFVMSFAVTVPVVTLLAVICDRAGRDKPMTTLGLLAFDWLVSALLISVFWGAIDANLYQRSLAIFPVWIVIVALIPVVIGIGIDWRWWLSRHRKEALRQISGPAPVIAEDHHGSGTMALVLLLIGAAVIAFIMRTTVRNGPAPFPVILALAVVAVAVGISALWAWRGFQYRFTSAAVEIRAFGLLLRRIPLSQIKDFKAETVSPLTDFGGWGIKGLGSTTAYIWGGKTALHIKTYTGDVYLGHADPGRLVRDLEQVMNVAPR
jgi:membrane protein YdbS with pleckstrin-like domain